MLFNNQDKYSNSGFRYTDAASNNFKERANKLNRDLNSGAFKDRMKIEFIKNPNITNNAKRSTYKSEIQSEEDLYQYKKKRGSSLQRFKEVESAKTTDHTAQRRSYNNPQHHFEDNQSLQNNEGRSENIVANTILKENIKKIKNNNDMPLQKLRMKQKHNYLKSNFVKTNEEIKATMKKQIASYQENMKRSFYKQNNSNEASTPNTNPSEEVHYRMSSNENNTGRESSIKREMPPKYTITNSSGSLSSLYKKIEDDKRNRDTKPRGIAYDRIGSKSPATRKKNVEKTSKDKKGSTKFNNIPRHTSNLYNVESQKHNKDKAIVNSSTSSDSSSSVDFNKKALNIRRTLAQNKSRDSSSSSSPLSKDFISSKKDKYYYKMNSQKDNLSKQSKIGYQDKKNFKTNSEIGSEIYEKFKASKKAQGMFKADLIKI